MRRPNSQKTKKYKKAEKGEDLKTRRPRIRSLRIMDISPKEERFKRKRPINKNEA